MSEDYYKILGVDKSASADEIKRAYRKKAHQHHPDKGGDSAKFKEINEAYQTLGNSEKRAQYDRFGKAGAQGFGGQGFPGGGFGGAQGFGGFSGGGFDTGGFRASGFSGGLGDIFEEMFSQAFSTVQAEIEITPAQAVLGDKLEATIGGEKVAITIPKGVQDGTTLRFQGKGNKTRSGARGDLHLIIKIKMPNRISKEEQELYEKIRDLETKKKKSWWGF